MGTVEFDVGFIGGSLLYDSRATLPIDYEGYARTVIAPGFSDGHAHPQVIDAGKTRRYRDSYDWIRNRRLKVDERGIREDPEVSSSLAMSTLVTSLFDGVTLIAITGSPQGNSVAIRRLSSRPRVIVQPTVMDRKGWLSAEDFLLALESYLKGEAMVGLFLHSLGMTSPETAVKSMRIAREKGIVMAIHLSEGVSEASSLKGLAEIAEIDGRAQIIAVHCFTEPESCRSLFRGLVSCPVSNLYLYDKAIRSPKNYDALGSDWPLLTGTVRRSISFAYALSGRKKFEVLERATLGGYRLYGVDWTGDALLFDDKLEKVLEGPVRPKFVFIGGKRIINEEEINGTYDYLWAIKLKEESVRLAIERYGVK